MRDWWRMSAAESEPPLAYEEEMDPAFQFTAADLMYNGVLPPVSPSNSDGGSSPTHSTAMRQAATAVTHTNKRFATPPPGPVPHSRMTIVCLAADEIRIAESLQPTGADLAPHTHDVSHIATRFFPLSERTSQEQGDV